MVQDMQLGDIMVRLNVVAQVCLFLKKGPRLSTETRDTQTDNFEADAESAITQTEGLDVIEGENVVITLRCPISLEIMEDPVSTPSGHTYDRKNIEEHIRRYRNDPVTKRPLRIDQLTSNYSIKTLIQKHKATRIGN